jgi:hypothetical protein
MHVVLTRHMLNETVSSGDVYFEKQFFRCCDWLFWSSLRTAPFPVEEIEL